MIRSRKKFRRIRVGGVLWFFGILAALYTYWLVMVNFIVSDFFDPPYAAKSEILRGRIAGTSGHPLWLVLGSSHVVFGFEPGVLAERMREKDAPFIYNFGLSGSGLFRQYITLQRVLADGFKPRRVGIEIFAADLDHELDAGSDAPSICARARPGELDDYLRYNDVPPDFMSIWKLSRLDPIYKYGMILQHQTRAWRLVPVPGIRRMEKKVFDEWGWVLLSNATTEQEFRYDFAVNRMRYKDDFTHFHISQNADILLHKILDLCRAKGIDAFLLEMPESEDFRALHTAAGDAELARFLAGIQLDYPVQIVDASAWVERAGFTDGHHLNGIGAMKFSLRFGDELFKMAAKQPSP